MTNAATATIRAFIRYSSLERLSSRDDKDCSDCTSGAAGGSAIVGADVGGAGIGRATVEPCRDRPPPEPIELRKGARQPGEPVCPGEDGGRQGDRHDRRARAAGRAGGLQSPEILLDGVQRAGRLGRARRTDRGDDRAGAGDQCLGARSGARRLFGRPGQRGDRALRGEAGGGGLRRRCPRSRARGTRDRPRRPSSGRRRARQRSARSSAARANAARSASTTRRRPRTAARGSSPTCCTRSARPNSSMPTIRCVATIG